MLPKGSISKFDTEISKEKKYFALAGKGIEKSGKWAII